MVQCRRLLLVFCACSDRRGRQRGGSQNARVSASNSSKSTILTFVPKAEWYDEAAELDHPIAAIGKLEYWKSHRTELNDKKPSLLERYRKGRPITYQEDAHLTYPLGLDELQCQLRRSHLLSGSDSGSPIRGTSVCNLNGVLSKL